MKIASPMTLTQPAVREEVRATLAEGITVTIELAEPHDVRAMHSYLESPHGSALYAWLDSEHAQTPIAKLDSTAQQNIDHLIKLTRRSFTPEEKLAIGIGSGIVTGAGVGILLQLSHAAAAADPTGAARGHTTVAFALGVGGLWGSGLIGKIDFFGFGAVLGPLHGEPGTDGGGPDEP